ncbi:ABC transporter permease [Micromonospora sp. NPDC050397]|uniref:ABC transporter permease n=1 Tax=Micromonospora sp. NPDC050397 TaxID=3364279 RepID=UPI00384BBE2E
MKLLGLFAVTFALSLRRSMAHRINLAFDLAQSLLGIGAVLATTAAIYRHTDLLAGWSQAETLVLTGIYAVVSGLRVALIDPSLSTFVGCVRDGTLDEYLLRPAPSWFTTTCREHAPLALGQSLLGVGIATAGVVNLPSPPRLFDIAVTLVLVVCSLVITWSVSLAIACMGFWAARFELSPLVGSLWDVGRYPGDVYRQPLRAVVTYVVPVAGMITLPASTLAGTSSPHLVVAGVGLTGIFVSVARLLFRRGVRRYTGATS